MGAASLLKNLQCLAAKHCQCACSRVSETARELCCSWCHSELGRKEAPKVRSSHQERAPVSPLPHPRLPTLHFLSPGESQTEEVGQTQELAAQLSLSVQIFLQMPPIHLLVSAGHMHLPQAASVAQVGCGARGKLEYCKYLWPARVGSLHPCHASVPVMGRSDGTSITHLACTWLQSVHVCPVTPHGADTDNKHGVCKSGSAVLPPHPAHVASGCIAIHGAGALNVIAAIVAAGPAVRAVCFAGWHLA